MSIKRLVSLDLLKIKQQALHSGKYTDCSFEVEIDGDDQKKVVFFQRFGVLHISSYNFYIMYIHSQTLHAMKSMLMMASPAFEAMFNSPLFSSGPVKITDSTPSAFSHFLEYVVFLNCGFK